MEKLRLGLVEISEVRWSGENDFWSGEFRITGRLKERTGVGIITNKEIGNDVLCYKQQSENLIILIKNKYEARTDDSKYEYTRNSLIRQNL